MLAPMGQAALGIEILENNSFLDEVANALNDNDTYICTDVERKFISKIGAGCSAPVAVNATVSGDKVYVKALIGLVDGSKILEENLEDRLENYRTLGEKLAELMISKGAIELLKEAEESAFKDIRPDRI